MPYRMESHHEGEGWTSMDRYNVARWKPKANALDAAVQCLVWTGMISIPAMQVVDVTTGLVVWRDATKYPEAGPSVVPEWDAMVRREAREQIRDYHAKVAAPPPEPREQPTLF